MRKIHSNGYYKLSKLQRQEEDERIFTATVNRYVLDNILKKLTEKFNRKQDEYDS